MQIHLKPHHAICIILFSESGHSAPYASIMREHISMLSSHPKAEVVLSSVFDAICDYCPHNNNLVCEKSDEVEISDGKILSYCGLKFGDRLSWENFHQIIIDNILDKDLLRDSCKGCTYLSRCEQINKER